MELDRLTALAARQVSEVERLLNSSGVSDADVWKLENAAVFERFRRFSTHFDAFWAQIQSFFYVAN